MKGISLIVLVITIIVMIILAGTIFISLNNSGIINKSSEAVIGTNESTVRELAQVAWLETVNLGLKNIDEIESYIINYIEKLTDKSILDDFIIGVSASGVEVFKESQEPIINVKDYGAKGDGKTDDTLAIRTATIELNKKGGTLYFPKGEYIVSILKESYKEGEAAFDEEGYLLGWRNSKTGGEVIEITNNTDNIIIDLNDSILKLTSNSYPQYSMIAVNGAANILIKNGTLIGDRLTHSYLENPNKSGITSQYNSNAFGHGIYSNGANFIAINNVRISDMIGDGIGISGNNRLTVIDDVTIHHCRRMGITIGFSQRTSISNTQIDSIGNFDGIERSARH